MQKIFGLVLLSTLFLGGCARLRTLVGSTTPYLVQFCATGAVNVPCRTLGTLDLPTGGKMLIGLVLPLAEKELTRSTSLSDCTFKTQPSQVEGRLITFSATAICTLHGAPVTEDLSLFLSPAPPPP